MHILVIEDDSEAAAFTVKSLAEAGHTADWVANGTEGLQMAAAANYDTLVIDRMLPGQDGMSVVVGLRMAGISTPVLFLSALGSVDERVRGLRAGGDDYLTKPFAVPELLARIEAISRRSPASPSATRLHYADLELDLLSRTASRSNQAIPLLPRQFKILEYLMRHADQVVTRTMLLENIWDYHFDPQTNVIDVHIARLRQKIDKGFSPSLIHTVRGSGYTLRM